MRFKLYVGIANNDVVIIFPIRLWYVDTYDVNIELIHGKDYARMHNSFYKKKKIKKKSRKLSPITYFIYNVRKRWHILFLEMKKTLNDQIYL